VSNCEQTHAAGKALNHCLGNQSRKSRLKSINEKLLEQK